MTELIVKMLHDVYYHIPMVYNSYFTQVLWFNENKYFMIFNIKTGDFNNNLIKLITSCVHRL